ncbi:MAG: SdrD B-like domain-containing protein [Candidatus Omnitrophota bacterium]|nr:SdrD B-like domain-containing protein [Candidatus Omnitrophota bacterium]MDZ4242123.1 SdrD B-like domain-containing protein [Candidatus Omnitrophota bacterium]
MRSPLILVCACWLAVCCVASAVETADPSQDSSYDLLIDLGRRALSSGEYDDASGYFLRAKEKDPSRPESSYYLGLIGRVQKRQSAVVVLGEDGTLTLPSIGKGNPLSPGPVKTTSRDELIEKRLRQESLAQKNRERRLPESKSSTPVVPAQPAAATKIAPSRSERTILMDDLLWASQPKTQIQLEKDHYIVLEGSTIDRFLVLNPNTIAVERLDRHHIKVAAVNRGTTFLHVWDDRGRWTFHIEGLFPQIKLPVPPGTEPTSVTRGRPFKLAYASNWSSFYTGPNAKEMERQNLSYTQWLGLYGYTPYGDVDAFSQFTKFQESTEVTGYGAGLTDGRVGPFEKFTLWGWDTSKRFSTLTLPGKYFRGVLWDAYAFDETINYTYLKGRDRSIFTFVSPDLVEEKNSYIEGGQITFFPKGDHQYALNYASGYGEARESFLKDRVFSAETRHKFNNWIITGEQAYDEEDYGRVAGAEYVSGDLVFRSQFRDIDRDFVTITGAPAGRGEIGGNLALNWSPGKVDFENYIDIFQDRFLPNPANPDALNYDMNTSILLPLGGTSSIRNSAFFTDTPGLISPRRSFRDSLTYSRSFEVLGGRTLSAYLGGTYQRNRFQIASSSDYDRRGVTSGLRLGIIKNLHYFIGYDYDWVEEIATGEVTNPNVITTGLNYSHRITKYVSGHWGISYRNEEEAGGNFSFLAGEDSWTGNVGLTFSPKPDVQVFADGRIRDVIAENAGGSDFTEGDIRLGLRSTWDLPIRWDRSGMIYGVVFKDINNNGRMEKGEDGIPGIRLRIGDIETVTDEHGEYFVSVKAQEVVVSVDMESVPPGALVKDALTQRVEIKHQKIQTVNFALNTRSGLYGVVYVDQNGNGRLDPKDIFIPRVKITLNKRDSVYTDFSGTYLFENIPPGRYTVDIDLNTIPIQYMPKIKLSNRIEVKEGTVYPLHVPLREKK